jgi:hypothetical protein
MTAGEQQSSAALAGVRIATYREIADHFGLGSPDAARVRAKRSGWEREPANHPLDPARVRVPLTVWERSSVDQTRSASPDCPLSDLRSGRGSPNRTPTISSPKSDPISTLSDAVEILREQLARERQQAEAATRDAANAREECARLQGELEAMRLALTALQEQRTAAQAEVTRVQVERGQAEERARTLQSELNSWAAGGPIARALRALLFRPQR